MASFTVTSRRARLGFRGRVFRGVIAAVLVVVLGFVFLEAFLFAEPGGEPAEEAEVDPAYTRSRPWQVVVDRAAAAIPTGQPQPDPAQQDAQDTRQPSPAAASGRAAAAPFPGT
jgi:hypothetical protein